MNVTSGVLSAAALLVFTGFTDSLVKTFLVKYSPAPIEGSATIVGNVEAGGTYLVNWSIVKRTDCSGMNSRVWEGADGFYLVEPVGETTLPITMEPRTYNIPTRIPELAPPGPLQLSIVGSYTCSGHNPVPFRLGPVITEVVE